MQKKTFTRWWNSYLKHRELKVEDLVKDQNTGLMLVNLMECISGEYMGKYNKKPRFPAQKLENVQLCLNYIKNKGLKLMGIGAEDIVGGNEKLILGLSWTLILRYEVQKYGADTGELLKWAKSRTTGYPHVDVQNFNESFNDGMAFCALIHKHYPDTLAFDSLDPANVEQNLNLAFNVAEKVS